MPARLIPADKLTHYALGLQWAALACLAVAVGRELYGWHGRGWRPFQNDDWREAGLDIASTLAGGALVLAAAYIGA
jgi:hypothetical protein